MTCRLSFLETVFKHLENIQLFWDLIWWLIFLVVKFPVLIYHLMAMVGVLAAICRMWSNHHQPCPSPRWWHASIKKFNYQHRYASRKRGRTCVLIPSVVPILEHSLECTDDNNRSFPGSNFRNRCRRVEVLNGWNFLCIGLHSFTVDDVLSSFTLSNPKLYFVGFKSCSSYAINDHL